MAKSSRPLRDPGRAEVSASGPQVSVVQLPAGGAAASPTSDVADFRRYLMAVRKRWPLAVTVALLVVFGFAVHSLRQPKLFRASATLSIDTTTPKVLTGVAEVVPVSTGWWDQEGFYEREYLVLQGREVARAAALRMGLVPEKSGQDVADLVLGTFSLDPDRKAKGVVRVAVIDQDPSKTAAVANAVAEAYAEYNLDRRVDGTKEAGTWLGLQHRDLKRKLELSEDALYQFMQDNDVLNASLESQLAEVMQRLSAFNGQLATVQAERIRGRLEREALQAAKEDPRLLDSLANIQQAGVVAALKGQLIGLKTTYRELSARYQVAHPKMETVKEQLDLVEQELSREIDAVLLSSERREASQEETERGLKQAIAEERQREARLNKLSLDYKRLQREVETNERLYEMVTSRMKEADLTGAMRFNNVQVLDRALVPTAPFKPNLQKDLVTGMLLGLLLGVALAIGLDKLDNTLKTQDEVEAALTVPFLGLLPLIEGGDKRRAPDAAKLRERDLYVLRNPKSSPAECARFIRTNLMFMGTDRPLQTLVVTSPGPQEGKTTTAVSLASTMAQAGSRVLLVDTDMRRPRLHRAFGLANERGVSNLIVGDASLDEVLQHSELAGLDVLVCGPTPPNPAELLHSRKFAELVAELRRRYDRVVFDAPPAGAVSDPLILGAQVDGTLVVLKCQKTTRDAAQQMVRSLEDANAHVVGAVLNDVDLASRRYGSYYSQYYRQYGGYYGDDDEGAAKA